MTDKPRPWGVGMPAFMHLHEFADICAYAFPGDVYLVGSALETKKPRDIDVRVAMSVPDFVELIGPVDTFGRPGTRWAALAMAFSALGTKMTGKSIDFQPQHSGIHLVYSDTPKLRLGTKDGER